ncbi:MAG: riboflavin biosynthesis protein RibF [Ruminococcus sp.]|nr:riboflavin biosynthesis protein RibF [Ruminococcus sp.]
MHIMKLVTDPLCQESAVALGLFDGVHLGHRRVLAAAAGGREQGLVPCAFTFDTETLPRKHGKPFACLYTQSHKLTLLRECGMEAVYAPSFAALQEMDGAAFCGEILCKKLRAKRVFCGRDFRFGRGAGWGFEELCTFGAEMGFSVHEIEPVLLGGEKVSSTRIRAALKEGQPREAALLLGRPYAVTGAVMHGKALGRTISFPTINQHFVKGQLVPKHGVYISRVHTPLGTFRGLTNVGIKPTVSEEKIPLAETHLLDFQGDLYGAACSTELLEFLRPEQKFESIDALRRAIAQDRERAQAFL